MRKPEQATLLQMRPSVQVPLTSFVHEGVRLYAGQRSGPCIILLCSCNLRRVARHLHMVLQIYFHEQPVKMPGFLCRCFGRH